MRRRSPSMLERWSPPRAVVARALLATKVDNASDHLATTKSHDARVLLASSHACMHSVRICFAYDILQPDQEFILLLLAGNVLRLFSLWTLSC